MAGRRLGAPFVLGALGASAVGCGGRLDSSGARSEAPPSYDVPVRPPEGSQADAAPTPPSRTAALPPRASILETLRLVNDAFMAAWPDPGADLPTKRPSHFWTRAVYYEGLMGLYRIDPNASYYEYAVRWGASHDWNLPYANPFTRHADSHACAQTYLDLFSVEADPSRIQRAKDSVDAMVDSRTSNDWTWIDAIQMSGPVFARFGSMFGSQYLDKLYELYSYPRNTLGLYNTTEHLWWRDASFLPPRTAPNGRNLYWSRGNGWVYAGLARILDALPKDSSHYREYLTDFRDMSKALCQVQRADGFWNVDLLDPNDYGGPEASGTSLFAYGFAWGLRTGALNDSECPNVLTRAWTALSSAVHPNGALGYEQGVGKQPSDSQPVSFDTLPSVTDFGIGLFLLAGSETWKLAP